MTLALASVTFGLIFIYAGFRDMKVADVVLGKPSVSKPPIVDTSGYGALSPLQDADGTQPALESIPAGVATIDGKQVAAWLVPVIKCARKNGWTGSVTSGYRNIEQQKAACKNVCGNPNGCPGLCAKPGQSNHQKVAWPNGAIDVSDPSGFQKALKKCGSPIKNALANDPVHFSTSGK